MYAYSVSVKSPISLMAEAHFQTSVDSEGSSSLTSDEPSVSSLPAKKNETYETATLDLFAPLITLRVV